MLGKIVCFIFGHTWVVAKRKKEHGYSYYQYTCASCGKVKEEL